MTFIPWNGSSMHPNFVVPVAAQRHVCKVGNNRINILAEHSVACDISFHFRGKLISCFIILTIASMNDKVRRISVQHQVCFE